LEEPTSAQHSWTTSGEWLSDCLLQSWADKQDEGLWEGKRDVLKPLLLEASNAPNSEELILW